MIAMFQVYLPFVIHVTASLFEEIEPEEISIGGNEIRFHPPYACKLSPRELDLDTSDPVDHLPKLLSAIYSQPVSSSVLVNGEPTVACNALRIDFIRKEFDRSPGGNDPTHELAFNLANNWLARLKILLKAAHVEELDPFKSIWRFVYLNDDETSLDYDPSLFRERVAAVKNFTSIGLNLDAWKAVSALPWGYEPSSVDVLLLDAQNSLNEVGPAIVLAATAVEVRIEYALDRLARLHGINPDLWEWINTRNNDLRKQPALNEQLDNLLGAITKRSLKADRDLWSRYQQLRNARNNFVHTGNAIFNGKPLDSSQAAKLVQTARDVVDWIDELLPHAERRPVFDNRSVEVQATLWLTSPNSNRGESPEV